MDEYIGTILLINTDISNRPLRGTVFCDGSLLTLNDPANEYNLLFGVIGTTYGGNGVDSFMLPDMRHLESGRMRYMIVYSGRLSA
jgi:microcystin-dependent protein